MVNCKYGSPDLIFLDIKSIIQFNTLVAKIEKRKEQDEGGGTNFIS